MRRCISPGRWHRISIVAVGLGLALCTSAAHATCTIGTNDIKASRALSFGAIVSGPSGKVTVTPGGTRTAADGAVILNSLQFASATSAEFKVCSATNTTVTIDLPTSATLTRSGGGSMTVDTFTRLPSSSSMNVFTGSQETLTVGATLNVGTSQAAGSYTGNFSVTVTYE